MGGNLIGAGDEGLKPEPPAPLELGRGRGKGAVERPEHLLAVGENLKAARMPSAS